MTNAWYAIHIASCAAIIGLTGGCDDQNSRTPSTDNRGEGETAGRTTAETDVVRIRFDINGAFPESWPAPPVNAIATEVPTGERDDWLTLIRTTAQRMPPGFAATHLDEVVVVSGLELYGTPCGSTCAPGVRRIYISTGGKPATKRGSWVRRSFMIQVARYLLREFGHQFPEKEWRDANTDWFAYSNGGISTIEPLREDRRAMMISASLAEWVGGVLNEFSRSSVENDFATVFGELLRNPSELQAIAGANPPIASKVDITRRFLASIDTRFDDRFFAESLEADRVHRRDRVRQSLGPPQPRDPTWRLSPFQRQWAIAVIGCAIVAIGVVGGTRPRDPRRSANCTGAGRRLPASVPSICIILIVSAAITWSSAIAMALWSPTRTKDMDRLEDDDEFGRGFPVPIGLDEAPDRLGTHDAFGLRMEWWYVMESSTSLDVVAAGWPFRSMEGWRLSTNPNRTNGVGPSLLAPPWARQGHLIIPVRPMALGFAANTAALGTTLVFAGATVGSLRRWRRRRRDRCPNCGYAQARDFERCPECGANTK